MEKKMKLGLAIAGAAVLALSAAFAGFGGSFTGMSIGIFSPSPGETITAFFTALKEGRCQDADKLLSSEAKQEHPSFCEDFKRRSKEHPEEYEEFKSATLKIIKENLPEQKEINGELRSVATVEIEVCMTDKCSTSEVTLVKEKGVWSITLD